jgi:hypothetical protein
VVVGLIVILNFGGSLHRESLDNAARYKETEVKGICLFPLLADGSVIAAALAFFVIANLAVL